MKRMMMVVMVLVIALMSVGFVGAQAPDTDEVPPVDAPPPPRDGRPDGQKRGGHGGRGFGGVMAAIEEATGLTREEIQPLLADGATLAEIIESNGGNVEAVKAALIADATERLTERYADDAETLATKLADLEEHIDDVLNGELPERPEGGRSPRPNDDSEVPSDTDGDA